MIFYKKDTSQHDCVPPNQILQMKFLEITFSWKILKNHNILGGTKQQCVRNREKPDSVSPQ